MGDVVLSDNGDGEYVRGDDPHYTLPTMNFKTLFAPAAALTLAITGVVFAPQATAQYRCSTDFFGNQNCSGTINGQRMNTRTSTDYFGNVNTTGTVGGQRFRQTCREDYFGNVNCR